MPHPQSFFRRCLHSAKPIQLFRAGERQIAVKIANLFNMTTLGNNNFSTKLLSVILSLSGFVYTVSAQSYILDMKRDSARSDKLTGGVIEKTALAAGEGNLKITINVPAFQMTLWQNGEEVKSYPIGVGLKDYPIYVGFMSASDVIWNPTWIPPSSDWVEASSTVKPGEIILPTDPRNPLGKVKIPLGYGYLIHQAKGAGDLGSLVSHGCVRVMQADLYDLAEKIVAARALPVSPKEIARAKATKKTLAAELAPPIPVEITYDTLVVEAGKLHVYPDVYARKTNTPERLLAELASSGVDASELTDSELKNMLARATGKNKFIVSVKNIETGKALTGGQTSSVVTQKTVVKKNGAARKKRR